MSLVTLNVNHKNYHVDVEPGESLLEVLRLKLNIGQAQYCKTGICGNCTVLLDGIPRQVCKTSAYEAIGRKIVTIASASINASHPAMEIDCIGRCLTF